MWKYTSTNDCNNFLLSLKLFNCSNKKKYIKTLYSISNNPSKYYKIYKIKKRNGHTRTIYEPSFLLKHIQRKILTNILNNKSISKYAKAYKKGLSIKENVKPHLNQKLILKLDIKNFFDSISFIQVYETCFSLAYFPKSIGILLTNLCTFESHLIQGPPTSAYISNLVLKDFDNKLGQFCEKENINYTRYSDDLTFSGDFNPQSLIKYVNTLLKKLNLTLNRSKTRIINHNQSQNIMGITVNQKIQVNKKYRSKIRQEIYYLKKFGLKSHLTKTNQEENNYLKKLYGKVLYVLEINKEDQEFLAYKNYLINLKDKS